MLNVIACSLWRKLNKKIDFLALYIKYIVFSTYYIQFGIKRQVKYGLFYCGDDSVATM